MGDRRMFTKKITDDDNFISLSSSAQALYLHLMLSCDDDGFSNQVNASMFKAHASIQDLEALLSKRYLYQFENGVIVIKHWRMANALRKDRYTPTAFQEELAKLDLKDNGSYTWKQDSESYEKLEQATKDDGCQLVASWLPQDKLSKDKLSKDKEDIYCPVRQDIIAYLNEKTSSHFRANCKASQRLIDARLKDGYTFEDFKKVIDTKCEQWLMDSNLAKYLRPETLFNATHFESYLNEVDPWKKAEEMYGTK